MTVLLAIVRLLLLLLMMNALPVELANDDKLFERDDVTDAPADDDVALLAKDPDAVLLKAPEDESASLLVEKAIAEAADETEVADDDCKVT